ncbi:MAG: hypothetical protein WB762_08915 [Candidatus Sulfotelmatobacter sp.]
MAKLPPYVPVLLDYDHVDPAYWFCTSLFAEHNPVIWHAMETYLHWLDTISDAQQSRPG